MTAASKWHMAGKTCVPALMWGVWRGKRERVVRAVLVSANSAKANAINVMLQVIVTQKFGPCHDLQ